MRSGQGHSLAVNSVAEERRMRPLLLPRRMAALELYRAAVARSESGACRDLQARCARCECYERCERDLRCDADNPAWKAFCPNSGLLNALTELWWLKTLI
jgi:hypothetical protein